MAQETIFMNEATTRKSIQEIEEQLNKLEGVERVLIDTSDGEVKVEFDSGKITRKQIVSTLEKMK